MPDNEPRWTNDELDQWARQTFGEDYGLLDEAARCTVDIGAIEQVPPEIRDRVRKIQERLSLGFLYGWYRTLPPEKQTGDKLELPPDDPTDQAMQHFAEALRGAESSTQRWERLSPEAKADLRWEMEEAAYQAHLRERGPMSVWPEDSDVDDSMAAEMSPLVGTGEVPGDAEAEPVRDSLRMGWAKWAMAAFGGVAVLLFVLFMLGQRNDDSDDVDTATESDTEQSDQDPADDEANDDESGDEAAAGARADAGAAAEPCAEGTAVVMAEGEVDPLVTPVAVEPHRTEPGDLYLEICFATPWDDQTLEQQWSLFAGAYLLLQNQGSYAGVEQHDGAREVLGAYDDGTEYTPLVLILPNGAVLIDMGTTAPDATSGTVEMEMASTAVEGDPKATATATAEVDLGGAATDATELAKRGEPF